LSSLSEVHILFKVADPKRTQSMAAEPDIWESTGETYPMGTWSRQIMTTKTDTTDDRLTYGGFIFWLQRLGINPQSVRSNHFGIPIGRGAFFSVSCHRVRPTNYRAMRLVVSLPRTPLFHRNTLPVNTKVAFKRVIVEEKSFRIDASNQKQLSAICREIQALIHPRLREHESIIKLQAIIWENGFGAGSDSNLPMWPTLVLEYCETTLADYQLNNSPLRQITKGLIGHKIGSGLEALHSVGIIHGDLKSENILLKIGEHGVLEPKLADFGSSVVLEKSNSSKKFFISGTEMWCAPEVCHSPCVCLAESIINVWRSAQDLSLMSIPWQLPTGILLDCFC
jgi:serine/threonine protein kinase